jgi:hypothetical protein
MTVTGHRYGAEREPPSGDLLPPAPRCSGVDGRVVTVEVHVSSEPPDHGEPLQNPVTADVSLAAHRQVTLVGIAWLT